MNLLAFAIPVATSFQRLLGSDLWYAVPLIAAISLVYAATRHEDIWDIARHAARVGVMIGGFMAAVLIFMSYFSPTQ